MSREALARATIALNNFVDVFGGQVEQIKRGTLNQALEAWDLTSDDYDALDETRKKLYFLLEQLNKTILPEMMQEHQTKTISLDSINKRFTVNQRVSCSMLDKDRGMDWLKTTGNNALIVPTVNAQTLSAFAKRYTQDEGKDMPADIFKISTSHHMSATKI